MTSERSVALAVSAASGSRIGVGASRAAQIFVSLLARQALARKPKGGMRRKLFGTRNRRMNSWASRVITLDLLSAR
jgi:hypothetical protein